MFAGILGGKWEKDKKKTAIFQDFNLDIIISKINAMSRGYDLQPLYSYVPEEREMIEYRRKITGDFRAPRLREIFREYSARIEKVKKYEKNSRYQNHTLQKEKWHSDALSLFAKAVTGLYEELAETTGYSEAMAEVREYVKEYIDGAAFCEWKELAGEIEEKMSGQAVTVSLRKNKIVLEEEEIPADFLKRVTEIFDLPEPEEKKRVEAEKNLSRFEEMLAEQVIKKEKLQKKLKQLMEVKIPEGFLDLAYEAQFYLGFYRFVEWMEKNGYVFALPVQGEEICVTAGYDAALAIKEEGRKVVPNDFSLGGEERFFVITGANGGGKTTFARMAGQILYFGQMGLLVPCRDAKLPYFNEILSHFSKEESHETGKGKLMEELMRLKPMMERDSKNCFVVLNELFTTAAALDAGAMGKKVLEHFIRSGCLGIYVTHIQKLAQEGERIVSLVAELEADHHTRSFKIVRKPAEKGEYEDSLITKYGMTYEQMKKVIEHEY